VEANVSPIHSPDLAKIYVDDLSYAGTHGHAYRFYGIDSQRGAVVVVRPDQREFPLFFLAPHNDSLTLALGRDAAEQVSTEMVLVMGNAAKR